MKQRSLPRRSVARDCPRVRIDFDLPETDACTGAARSVRIRPGASQKSTNPGDQLGKVTGAHNFGAGDLIEIEPERGGTFLLPFTEADFPGIDTDARCLTANRSSRIRHATKSAARWNALSLILPSTICRS